MYLHILLIYDTKKCTSFNVCDFMSTPYICTCTLHVVNKTRKLSGGNDIEYFV